MIWLLEQWGFTDYKPLFLRWTGTYGPVIISEYYDSIQDTKRSILFNNIYVGPLKMEQPYIPSRLKSNQPETMGQGLARQS